MICPRAGLLLAELRHLEHHAERDGVEVGVEERAAVHAGGAADDLDVDAVAAADREALLDRAAGERDRLLHADRVVVRVRGAVQTGFLGEEAVHAVAGDHDLGVHVAVGAVGADADHRAALVADEAGGRGRAHERGAVVGGL